jgi:hypothetical protein
VIYRLCRCGKHKIWFWERLPGIRRFLAWYRQRKLERQLALTLAEEIRKEIDAEIIRTLTARMNDNKAPVSVDLES